MFLESSLRADLCLPSFERPIDLVHLARQSLGDRALEREILDLFVTQARLLRAKLQEASATQQRMDLAHTLKGSARAVGAWRVAHWAEQCELDAASDGWDHALGELASAIEEACASISHVQANH